MQVEDPAEEEDDNEAADWDDRSSADDMDDEPAASGGKKAADDQVSEDSEGAEAGGEKAGVAVKQPARKLSYMNFRVLICGVQICKRSSKDHHATTSTMYALRVRSFVAIPCTSSLWCVAFLQ